MAVVSVHGYSFASTFKLKELVGVFPVDTTFVKKDQLVAKYGEERYAIAFDFGAVVFIGTSVEEQLQVITAINHKLGNEPHPPTTENFLIEVVPGAEVTARFDRVIVPELSFAVMDIVATVVAQSAAMDYYDDDVAEIEVEMDRLADQMRATGKIAGRQGGLIQFIGLCIATRNDVISTLALFDKPDVTWENEGLDRLWNALHVTLEIAERYRTLETKLRAFQDNLSLLVDLSHQRRSRSMEWLVILLIGFEALVMIWQVWATKGH